ncbi:MAG: hypothetical protein JWR74_2053 [Polaromonas sp.]|jgi:hypothetical protein|nr:hypothetical protein [Polaromonas sp.]
MRPTSKPLKRKPWDRVTLAQFQRIHHWRKAQRATHPVESWAWEAMLTLWMMGWVGWIPAYEAEAYWAFPLCIIGILSPRLYVYWRSQAHAAELLRCEWLDLLD